jgi:Family of unknown function (DUF6069)
MSITSVFTTPTPSPSTAEVAAPTAGRARPVVVGGLLGVALALAGCSVVYVIGNLGAPIRVVTGWAPDGADLTVEEVVITIMVAVTAGAVLLGAAQRRLARPWRAWMITAAVVAVASTLPLFHLDIDAGSKLALASMHLTTGVAAIAGHALVRRPRPVRARR